MPLVWLITGTSSGFGHEFVTQLLSRGDKVIATARILSRISDLKQLGPDVVTLELDVTASQRELNDKAAEAIQVFGKVDVLVNNAGFVKFGFLEDLSEDDYIKQFKTNVFGPINVARAFLPHFRSQRSGTIVNIGSMSAWETYPGVGPYSASKAALRYATEALSQELGPTGIKTLLVEPGQFRTELLGPSNSVFVETKIPEYQDAANASFGAFRSAHSRQRGDPVKGVARIIDVVKGEGEAAGREWPGELVLGQDAIRVIKKKCDGMLRLLSDWEGFSSSTDV
ncbi:hypothetical protein AN9378.2 [Aspergillus nidulans FGSC A4]|uniref:Uncharacterized protein n=1 Tax=Emericella nidulans (strain FGSC A4 / ATCC 38163 / CBS 112.46 / NRRL 194 / M139) TaxID=227321 RepID=Q5AQQ2_EMENI|nr:hypothetical protein [Aspergillus nidulans FGSC A4]EAA66445.1 hypothetical protein AN9378.2 [Aspergillus nidulans FGSC A4]CBF87502.1 TPA: conserved hypothetical protein [Aspergillus nidulans FGSC A4]|eukprot:XP_682647.1 hypothetical protein AN9378.2 [Aspergillus nidulans FGSC A4]